MGINDLSTSLQAVRNGLDQEIALHGPLIPIEGHEMRRNPAFAAHMMLFIQPKHPVRSLRTLEEVQAFVERTQLVPIDAQRTRAVPGEGNPKARLVVIGEAPGADEDLQGRPFVGRAGKLLDKMLAAISLSRDEFFITNILKSRPPGNRNPKPDEIAAHIPVLYRQLSLIQPQIILCLGRVAAGTLLNTRASLRSMRGKVHDFHGTSLVVTFHPAALLRNAAWKRPAWEDLQRLQQMYTNLKSSRLFAHDAH